MIRVYGPRRPAPAGARCVNTTSKSHDEWSKGLSPFFAGPLLVWPGNRSVVARNVENAWQFSKVYDDHVGPDDLPTAAHAAWALQGWRNPQPVRFPRGRGAKPRYAIYRNQCLGYVAARLYVYIPSYVEGLAVNPASRAALIRLREEYRVARAAGDTLALYDYDGYDHVGAGMSIADVFLCENKKAGHGFVLAALLGDTLVADLRAAADRSEEARSLAARGFALPPVPDFAPLRASEAYDPYRAVGAEVCFRAGFLGRLADEALRALLPGGPAAVDWQQRQVNVFGWKDERRLTAFYGDDGAKYKYSGRDNDTRPWADDATGTIVMIRGLLELVTGERYNLCLLNLYADKTRDIGKHSDDEADLARGSRIASVSLGSTRRFCMEPKNEGGTAAAPLWPAEFLATHGCLITMGGTTQQLFKHWVPQAKTEEGPRINLTYRQVRHRV